MSLQTGHRIETSESDQAEEETIKERRKTKKPREVEVGQKLVGRRLGDIYSFYTGVNGEVPAKIEIIFKVNLRICDRVYKKYA
ncbi:MAG: hypothetical protein HYZ51_01155 [Candidatus Doudnabacteria bacterium]|nr:hypothetical protein [Candidatus Doudnabacteria bacterium]